MDPQSILYTVLIALSLGAIALLSMAETAFISVNKYKIRSLIERGNKSAEAVKRILDHHERLFSAVIVSGNLFTILATSMGTAMAIDYLGQESGVAASTVMMTFLTVMFGELTPKSLAVTHADRLSLLLARPAEMYIKLISPLVWVLTGIMRLIGVNRKSVSPILTVDELKAMISIGEEEGALEEEEREMLHRVFEFGDKEVSEVMVPRTDVVSVAEEAAVSEVMKLVEDKGYSRYPVFKETVDNVSGILYIKDIMIKLSKDQASMETPIRDIMREPYFVPETKMVSQLLDEMQKKNFHIAMVIDEYGGTDGLVTLEDIFEELVGSLRDEFEAASEDIEVEIIDERTFIVAGQTDLDEVNEILTANLQSEDYNTIGGFVFGLFGRLPVVGEQVRFHSLRFLVLEMEGKRISKLKVTKL